jgi:hypothetical protein
MSWDWFGRVRTWMVGVVAAVIAIGAMGLGVAIGSATPIDQQVDPFLPHGCDIVVSDTDGSPYCETGRGWDRGIIWCMGHHMTVHRSKWAPVEVSELVSCPPGEHVVRYQVQTKTRVFTFPPAGVSTGALAGGGTFTPPIHACERPFPHLHGEWIVIPGWHPFCAENVGPRRERRCARHEHFHHGYEWEPARRWCHAD